MADPARFDNPLWERLRVQVERLAAAPAAAADPAALAKRLEERAQVLRRRAERPGEAGERRAVVAFRRGPERYGVPVAEVLEVQDLEHFSPVPGAPPAIRGVAPWRGAIVSLLDLGRLFGVAASGLSDLKAFLVVEAAGKRLGILAGEVEGILDVPTDRLRPAPALSGGVPPEWVAGVVEENRLILRMGEIVAALAGGGAIQHQDTKDTKNHQD